MKPNHNIKEIRKQIKRYDTVRVYVCICRENQAPKTHDSVIKLNAVPFINVLCGELIGSSAYVSQLAANFR